jgi:serine/threonine protein kinase
MSDPIQHATFVAPDPAALAPLFAGYVMEGLIATGGMGAVYRAVQRSLDRPVAIKILPREFSTDEAFRTIFEAEAKAMAKLNHPNLIGVYDFGEVDGMLYIIMEYVPGKSLFHSAHGMAIDPSEVVHLVTAICHGLAHAHEHGIIHRDIKPSNILLDLEARPKIGDFGLARNTGQTAQEGEEIFGTPHYTAPEVVNAPQSVDHRADIFSLGVMLHELLTGHLPADDPRPPSAITLCDPRFDAIVRRATEIQPERRYNSALEIANELQAISTSPGPKVLRTTTPGRTPQAGRHATHNQPKTRRGPRSKQSSKAGMIVLLLIAIAATGLFYQYLLDHRARNDARGGVTTIATPPPLPAMARPEPDRSLPQPRPAPEIVGDEEPAAQTPPDPDPEMETGHDPVTVTDPESDPQPETEIKPVFDVADFLDNRARKIMRERCAPLVTAKDAELARNLSGYERDLMSAARKEGRSVLRDAYISYIKSYITKCRGDGNTIPDDLPESIENLAGAAEIHAEFLIKQSAITEKMVREISSLADTYILGLEKQIERLREQNDTGAIQLLEREIDLARENEKYFPDLMLQN